MALAGLTETLQNTTLNGSALVFSPHTHARWSDLELQPVPRFLFRIYTPKSDGFTDEHEASSRDATSEAHKSNEDVFSAQTPEAIATRIADHLWWRKLARSDNLVSWSSSMLFLVPYIFYRHHESSDRSSLHDIRLLVIDTERFPARTFIRDSDLISAFKEFDTREEKGLKSMAHLRSNTDCYFGEYLSQGSLRISGKCSSVSAQTMIERGLFDLHFVFGEAYEGTHRDTWVVPVRTARKTIETAPKNPPAALEQLTAAFDIAIAFGGDWRLPIAVQLLAILPHGLDPCLVYKLVGTHLASTTHEVDRCAVYWQTLHAPLPMPELVRGKSIMRKLFIMHLQDVLLQAKSTLIRTISILSEYSSEHSTVADTLQRAADVSEDGYNQLEAIGC
ncbi:hypothetical protein LTR56_026429 [Elasticomyces elasticus]|nr:hypothetical protein LTR56_026429 [Elasticomyces elasticus]